jgi:hypothetical protein
MLGEHPELLYKAKLPIPPPLHITTNGYPNGSIINYNKNTNHDHLNELFI